MPKFGLTMHEGTVQRHFKAVGDPVQTGEPLYEVETEKVLYEVESPATGTLAVILVDADETAACGAPVAVIAEPGEDPGALAQRYANRRGPRADSRPSAGTAAPQAPAAIPSGAEAGARRTASPVARKLAAELGLELGAISGTGPGGRITREDVERAAALPAASAPPPAARAAAPGSPERIALRGARKVIAERMHASLRDSAQITITAQTDVTPATELHAQLKPDFGPTYTDLLVHAVARALLRHPRMNARLEGDEIVTPAEPAIGIAVALPDGLIVPVIHRAARKALREIAAESKALAERARAGRLRLEEVSGGTFTITNLGAHGIDAFTPILMPGETGILGAGRIAEQPAAYRGAIALRAIMTLSLTFDHRVIDGAPAAEFLRTIIEYFNYGER
ncbi:MAG TPA: dihydrolipoamide acetyltransferase family protein [Candidatus Binataceae bacterium]|nr:dihydrolipoamide acetyltransferase family protein [Candidatus Binataceae bacterium]